MAAREFNTFYIQHSKSKFPPIIMLDTVAANSYNTKKECPKPPTPPHRQMHQ